MCMYDPLVKMQGFVVLLLSSVVWTTWGSAYHVDAPDTLLFQYKNDAIFTTTLPTSPSTSIISTPITSIKIPTEYCHGNSTINLANIVDFDYDPLHKRTIFITWNERMYSNSNNQDELLLWYDYYDYIEFSGRRIAVDSRNKKIYSIDQFVNPAVEVIDFDGRYRSILFAFEAVRESKDYLFEGWIPDELETAMYPWLVVHEFPVDLVLDVEEGVMFVRTNVSRQSRIHRVDMDGTNRILLVPDAGDISDDSFRIVADPITKRIYWYDVGQEILESVDYKGNGRIRVLKVANLIALAVYNNRVIWSQDSIDPATRGRIYSCILTNFTCNPSHIITTKITNSTSTPYKLQLRIPPSTYPINPCDTNNGNCQHLCLLKPNNTHSCACRIGHRLASNQRDCIPILEFLVYEANNYIRGRALDDDKEEQSFSFPLSAVQYAWGVLERNQVAGMEYNTETGMVLYLECRNMVQLDLDRGMRGCWSIERWARECYKHLAYDWKAGKVYLTKQQDDETNEYVLGVVDVPPTFKRRAVVTPAILYLIDYPLSLVTHLKTGYVYLLTHNSTTSKSTITRMTVGGYNSVILNISGTEKARGLAIDQDKDRLYWYGDDLPEIRHVALDGSDVQTLAGAVPVMRPDSMVVEDDWVYMKNATSVWRVKKITGSSASCVVPERPNTKLKSTMRVIKRSRDHLYYGDDYQITKAACKVFCTYKDFKENINKADEEFCKCPKTILEN